MEFHSERQTANAVFLSCESAAAILVAPASTLHCCSACVWQGRLERRAALETETRSQIFWKCAALGVLLLISETQLLYGKKTHASARARAHTLLPSFNMHTHYKLWIQRLFFFLCFIETGFCSDASKLKTHRGSDFLPCKAAALPSLPCLTQQAACFGWVAGLSSSFKVLDSYYNQGFLLYISIRNKSDKSY